MPTRVQAVDSLANLSDEEKIECLLCEEEMPSADDPLRWKFFASLCADEDLDE